MIIMVVNKIVELLSDYRRVLSVAKKPGLDDMKEMIRVCGIGILAIGVIGFLFFLLFAFTGGY